MLGQGELPNGRPMNNEQLPEMILISADFLG
jgi:hypothetical protein